MSNLVVQNQMLLKIIKSRKKSSSDTTKHTYMKNVLKFTCWDTKDKQIIMAILTDYETYYDASSYNEDKVRVWNFVFFSRIEHP